MRSGNTTRTLSAPYNSKRAYIRFDSFAAHLPAGAKVVSAQLDVTSPGDPAPL